MVKLYVSNRTQIPYVLEYNNNSVSNSVSNSKQATVTELALTEKKTGRHRTPYEQTGNQQGTAGNSRVQQGTAGNSRTARH